MCGYEPWPFSFLERFSFFGGMSEGHLFLGGFGFWLDEKRPFVFGGIWFLVG
jgi:hypothetical protein